MKIINQIVKSKFTYYFFSIVLFFILSFYDLKIKLDNLHLNYSRYIVAFVIMYFLVIVITNIIIKVKDSQKIDIDKLFPIVCLSFGILYLLFSPLFTGSDEHNHYYRIYEITESVMTTPVQNDNTVGGKLPSSLYYTFTNKENDTINRNTKIKYKDELSMSKYKLNRDKKMQYGKEYATEYSNTALYCPIQYFPQIVGFMIGKAFNLSPFYIGELGRLFNLLFYVIVCSIFLKRLPRLKTFAALVLLSPMLISNATTLSADGFTNSLIFAFISLIIYHLYGNEIKLKDKILYFVLSILLASCKIVYLPFTFLLFLLPNKSFDSKKNKFLFIVGCILSSVIVGLIWLKFTSPYFDAYYVNSNLQKKHILHNLVWYLSVVIRTYFTQANQLLMNLFVGNNMYHSQLGVYNVISIAYIVVVVLAFFVKEKNTKYNKLLDDFKSKLIPYGIMVLVLALITTAIYIQCTATFIEIDSPVVFGLQGRYYLALVLCTLLVGNKQRVDFNIKSNNILLDVCFLIHSFTLIQMFICFVI